MSASVESRNETVTNLVTACLSRAKLAHLSYVEQISKLVPAETNASETHLTSLSAASKDAEDNLDFALQLLSAADNAEIEKLQGTYSHLGAAPSGEAVHANPLPVEAKVAECSIASAAAAAVTDAGALQTMELDSSAIAAELEATVPDIDVAGLEPVEATVTTAGDSEISTEIEALSARIREAKARAQEPRAATDDEVAAAVAAAELLDNELEVPIVDAAASADVVVLQSVTANGAEETDDVGAAAAELETLLLADDDEVKEIEAAAVQEHALVATDADVLSVEETVVVAGVGEAIVDVIRTPQPSDATTIVADASGPAVVVLPSTRAASPTSDIEAALGAIGAGSPAVAGSPSIEVPFIEAPINVIANETTVGGKSFSLDLAAQLDAVRAMIRGNSTVEVAKEAAKSVGK